MSTKPCKKIITTQAQRIAPSEDETIKPFKVETQEVINTNETLENSEQILENNNNIEPLIKSTNLFSTFNGLLMVGFKIPCTDNNQYTGYDHNNRSRGLHQRNGFMKNRNTHK